MSEHSHFVIGASVGTGMQPTAIAVLEQVVLKNPDWRAENGALKLRHLERLPLDTNYPGTVEAISKLLKRSEIKDKEQCGEPDVLLDITGSGRAIEELFEREGIDPILVRVVGSGYQEEKVPQGEWRVPRLELVGALRVLYEAGRLETAKKLELLPTLLEEIRAFKMQRTRIDLNDPESWRERPDEDLILAVALTAWRASRRVPYPQDEAPEFKDQPYSGPDAWMSG